MGVVDKLKDLAKVELTLNRAPATATATKASPTSAPSLTAEQLLDALETAQRRGLHP